jgi:Arc/MetJ-type ribon-helix-helix transcriptional regulator
MKRGQKALDGRKGAGPSRVITMRLTDAQVAALDRLAAQIDPREGRSGVIRLLIEERLQREQRIARRRARLDERARQASQ